MSNSLLSPTRRPRMRSNVLTLGLDIGSRAAKCVLRVTCRGATTIVSASSCRLEGDAWQTPDSLVAQLEPLLRSCGQRRNVPVVCSFSTQVTDLESFEAEAVAGESPRAAAQQHLDRLLGPASREVVFDYLCGEPSASTPNRMHVAWINQAYAEQFTLEMERIGVRCSAIDAVPAALARLANQDSLALSSTLVVNLSAEYLTFVSVLDSAVTYVRSRIRFAPGSAAESLAASLGLRLEVVETLLSDWGLNVAQNPAAAALAQSLTSKLAPWLHALREEIARTTAYLQQLGSAESIARIVLCGGGACLRGLEPWLEESLGIPVESAALPADWEWRSAVPFSPRFAQAVALTQHGDFS